MVDITLARTSHIQKKQTVYVRRGNKYVVTQVVDFKHDKATGERIYQFADGKKGEFENGNLVFGDKSWIPKSMGGTFDQSQTKDKLIQAYGTDPHRGAIYALKSDKHGSMNITGQAGYVDMPGQGYENPTVKTAEKPSVSSREESGGRISSERSTTQQTQSVGPGG